MLRRSMSLSPDGSEDRSNFTIDLGRGEAEANGARQGGDTTPKKSRMDCNNNRYVNSQFR